MPNYYLSASDALAFLLVHDPTDARAFGFDLPFDDSESVPEDDRLKDLKGTSLTVKTTSEDPLKQDITVKVSGIERQFKFSGKFDYHKGDYRLKDVTDKKGTLYIRGTKPHGENGFNAQQYPQYKKGVTDIGDTLNVGALPRCLSTMMVLSILEYDAEKTASMPSRAQRPNGEWWTDGSSLTSSLIISQLMTTTMCPEAVGSG